MEFIYLTSKKYPSRTADHFFVKEMANAFGGILGEKFSLVLANDHSGFFKDVRVINLGLKWERGRTVYYFFWLLFWAFKNRKTCKEVIFFSNDPNLLCDLIIIKKIFRFKYQICSEWHMLYDDWQDAFIVRNSDFVVATSKRLMSLISERTRTKITKDKFLVVYGGADAERYSGIDSRDLRKNLGLPEDKILVAYVGLFKTLGVKKSIDVMINSLAYLPENVNMLFVGGKKEEVSEYFDMIPDKKLIDRCIFVEKQESERVPLYQKAANILVIPNPNKYPFNDYCIPMKIYEYLAAGKPIVYSNLVLLDEVLHDCGLSFIPDDSKDLSKKISAVLTDKSGLFIKKSNLCLEKAEEYSWHNRAFAILKFLNIKI